MTQQSKKSITVGTIITMAFTVLVLIVSAVATFTYNAIAKFNIISNEIISVKAFSNNVALYTDMRFKEAIASLNGYSVAFSDADNMTDEEITEKLIYCADNSFFCHIAFVDDDGRTCTNGEMGINPRVYAGSSLTGSMNIAPGANIYSVPVHSSSGSIVGTLVGKLEDNAAANASFKAYGVSGVTYILNTDGTIINCSNHTASGIAAGDNLITVLSDENDINLIRTHLSQNDVSDSFKVTYKDEEYILAMTSLETQAWTLVSLVPCSAVIDFYSNITAPLNYMIFGLTAVFVILAGYLFYFTHRVRKTAEGIIDENNKINYVDDITGYSSWKSFMENYDKAMLDTGTKRAFLALDIDKFKTVNDTLGYEGGNEILRKISEIIERDIGDNDFFARNGGDHFFMVVEYKNEKEITEIVNHIISDIEYQITEIKITVSIGIYPITDANMKIRAAADRANLARNSIKSLSESRFAFFNQSMMENIREEKNIENIMEDALEKREFVVYLQPKYGLGDETGEVIGAEALVRWYHNGEIISPGKFIPIFEKNGFVTKLDFYMFEEVCKLQKSWKNQGLQPKIISVNMSRLHFPNPDFVSTLKNYCDAYDIDTKYFEIEITESAAYENINILMNVFSEIKSAGFHVSIDDFGTGYSSLNLLKDLPVDVLKIDRSFLTENADEEESASKIIACVVSLASSLDISTICEGIETKEQASLLSKLGCNMAQGFYFARPMPVKDFEKLVYNLN